MRIHLILIIWLVIGLLHGCKNQPKDEDDKANPKENIEILAKENKRKELYEKLKGKKLDELTGSEKQKAITDWVNLLKSDSAFIDAEKSLRDFTSEILNRDRSKDIHNAKKWANAKKDRIAHFESMGIQHPGKADSSHSNLIKNFLIIIRKYPELKDVDKPTLKIIFSRATGRTNFSEMIKRSPQTSKITYADLVKKKKHIPELVAKLKSDKNFIKMNRLQSELNLEVLEYQSQKMINSSNLSQKGRMIKKFDRMEQPKYFMQIASLRNTLILQYPELQDLTREEIKVVFKQAKPKLNPKLKSKKDSLLRLMLDERMRNK